MNERIKKLRRALDLTQQEFGDRIGIKRNTLANYEIGRNEPIDAVVSLICREFHVSEVWLRSGEGEMFTPEPEFDLGEYAKRHGMTALETEILKAYLDIDPAVRGKLLQHFRERLSRDAVPAEPERPDLDYRGQEIDMAAIDAQVEEYRRQLLLEQEQALQTSSANDTGDGARMA